MLGQSCFGLPHGDLLYSQVRTGPLVPARPGDDQEQIQRSGNFWRTHSDPTCRSGVGVLVLTRWHSCLAYDRTPAVPLVRA